MTSDSQIRNYERAYITSELKRTRRLEKAFLRYASTAHKLGFHPLDRSEISQRLNDLHNRSLAMEVQP